MSTTISLEAGTPVRFCNLTGSAGLCREPNLQRFVPDLAVHNGDAGFYAEAHPNPALADEDWHLITVRVAEQDLVAPVHRSMFEVLPPVSDVRPLPRPGEVFHAVLELEPVTSSEVRRALEQPWERRGTIDNRLRALVAQGLLIHDEGRPRRYAVNHLR